MEYIIIKATTSKELEKLVTQALKDGYSLAGGVCVCVPLASQIELLQAIYKTG